MTRAGQVLALAGALLLAAGCRPLTAPAELVAFEKLRRRSDGAQARRQPGALAAQSEAAHVRAVAAWRDADLRGARHHAVVGQTTLRTAAALREERSLRAQVAALWGQLGKEQAEEAMVKDKLAQLQEMVQLHEELALAQTSALEKALHLSEVQESTRAVMQLEQARLALKMAELVGAARYARKPLSMARTLIDRAARELTEQQAIKAFATAALAHKKAQKAQATARPRYLRERAAASRQAQNQALQRELTALAATSRWLSVTLQARGNGQELVVPVQALFLPLGTTPLKAKRKLLDGLAGLLKRFPDYHVVIRGHTSHRSPRAKRPTISRLRARRVADQLIAAGLAKGRLLVRGEGAARLIAYRRSSLNDRVEICVLLR